jgi:hypothetical protein
MGRTLSLLPHLPRLEEDGTTHRRECECVRCDAGFRPTEHERALARARWDHQKARDQASRLLARRRERERLKAVALELQLGQEERVVDDRVRTLRAVRQRVDHDRRLALLQSLRRSGVSLREALVEVERRVGSEGERVGPAGIEPAANGLKVRSSTS